MIGPPTRGPAGAGFSLVELLVGVALLSFISLGITTLITLTLQTSALAEDRSVATSIVNDRVRQISAMPLYAATDFLRYKLPEETAVASPQRTFTTDYGQIPGFPDYKRVVELRYDVPQVGMLAVEGRVYWRQLSGSERDHTMVTYIASGLD